MKTTIGGDRLGSGNKQQISARNYERSTHDLSSLWRSSMSAGTLVPFMSELALPGDSWDIDLQAEVLTLPTVGPLFGRAKVQLDVFQVPIRLYNAGLHMNKLGIGMDMASAYLPQLRVFVNNHTNYKQTYEDNEHINPSALLKYLGISGVGNVTGISNPAQRYFNAVPFLAYWDIYKNYYANKQEERGFCVHTQEYLYGDVISAYVRGLGGSQLYDIFNATATDISFDSRSIYLEIGFENNSLEPAPEEVTINIDTVPTPITDFFQNISWDDANKILTCRRPITNDISADFLVPTQQVNPLGGVGSQIQLEEFPLSNIDDMREDILQYPYSSGVFKLNADAPSPYGLHLVSLYQDEELQFSVQFSQEQLALKTYQSDLLNNWISTEWIDGTNGINEVTAVSTAGDSFTIDALNIANKVYNMLNRIAISGGTYDDWLDAVYTHERSKSIESPVYHGSLIKELGFQEVVSNASTNVDNDEQPLGTLAGRGKLTDKHKGGKMVIKIHEPSYIIGIVSITPLIDYSQGNKWDMNLKTLDDLHKPALDAIGFQDLITDQMSWTDTDTLSGDGTTTFRSAGKQPAWINYMTAINRVYGNFADQNKEMFMTFNRRYDKNVNGRIADLTTYIDPTKFNHIFAQTSLDSQNYWVQIAKNLTVRRKMSAKIIPNL